MLVLFNATSEVTHSRRGSRDIVVASQSQRRRVSDPTFPWLGRESSTIRTGYSSTTRTVATLLPTKRTTAISFTVGEMVSWLRRAETALSGQHLLARQSKVPQKGKQLTRVPSLVTNWNYWLMLHPESTTYDLFDGKKYASTPLPKKMSKQANRFHQTSR